MPETKNREIRWRGPSYRTVTTSGEKWPACSDLKVREMENKPPKFTHPPANAPTGQGNQKPLEDKMLMGLYQLVSQGTEQGGSRTWRDEWKMPNTNPETLKTIQYWHSVFVTPQPEGKCLQKELTGEQLLYYRS